MIKNFFNNEFFKRTISGIILGFCFFGSYLHSQLLFSAILGFILFIILFFEWPNLIGFCKSKIAFVSFLYPILSIFILIFLNVKYRNQDILFPLYPFIVSWVADTSAYIFGKLFGKHKICPKISPKKSWEGLVAGFFGVTAFNIAFLPAVKIQPFVEYTNSFFILMLFSLIITIVAFIGDISISYLKRKSNLKDTGDLLPGHGGLLDRFDSVFFIAILIYLIILLNFKC